MFILHALVALAFGVWQAQSVTSGDSCTTPMPPQHLPLPRCEPSNATLEDAKQLAWTVAPRVHFHPLEPWHLQVRQCRSSMAWT
jgi:hypothetical protein